MAASAMTGEQPPDWGQVGRDLGDSLKAFSDGMAHAGDVLRAQAAMGWLYRGDLVAARGEVERLGDSALLELSTAAAALSGLADEVRAGRGTT